MSYQFGDIVLTRGSAWLSRAIRYLTRGPGESATLVNHAALVVQGSSDLRRVVIVEALMRVKMHGLLDRYGPKSGQAFAVFRPRTMTFDQRQAVRDAALAYVGRKYGMAKLLLHLGDWCLGGRYFFRRLGVSKYPICSYLVARSFYDGAGLDFGIPARAASPDDIWDFVTTSKHYECIRPLRPYL